MPSITSLKYPLRTLWQFFARPMDSIHNTGIALAAFTRTIIIGRRLIWVLKRHRGAWSDKTRGRYAWRVAKKFWARWILEKAGIEIEIVGLERVDWSRPHIIVSNHQSTLDVLILVAHLSNGRFVAKKETLKFPFVGKATKNSAQIVIDRGNHTQAMAAIRSGVRVWPSANLIFFAEGRRSRDGRLGMFKRGAFAIAKETGLPIVPVAIGGAYEALPRGSLLRLRRHACIRLELGREIAPKEFGSVSSLAEKTRMQIGLMKEGLYSDSLFAKKAT